MRLTPSCMASTYPSRLLFSWQLAIQPTMARLEGSVSTSREYSQGRCGGDLAEGRSRGFGTVLFATADDALKALEMYDGYEIKGREDFSTYGSTTSAEEKRDEPQGELWAPEPVRPIVRISVPTIVPPALSPIASRRSSYFKPPTCSSEYSQTSSESGQGTSFTTRTGPSLSDTRRTSPGRRRSYATTLRA
ncbi:hypothetical protein Pst134EA_032433 [Puccinia striiformis f. sp. tritici]|uniref:uncharacterized protein n=1 Tax=Puccinia striiformis f. sp. tritici TaxID=168172 RepID=UPI00200751DA|nr:uncharacterized protein Pst134EA_032433 [Puccinia striiformis f. sp. tritici]KAH9444261.1 hypothetical protein Pst134EA_032433 [Puccinia striiformis f. sp. tritici]